MTIVDDRPMSRRRLRRLAERSGLVIERELIVLPDFGAPLAVIEDVEWAVHSFWRSATSLGLRTLPTRRTWRIARVLPWAWTGRFATGRVVLARHR